MIRILFGSVAAAALAITAAPAIAQDEPEQARTTYSVEFLRFAPGKADKWTIIRRNQFTEVTGPGGISGNPDPAMDPSWAVGWVTIVGG